MSTRARAVSAAGAVAVAMALDATVREPPLLVHPVRAVGRYLGAVEKYVPSAPRRRATVAGGVAWGAGAVGACSAGVVIERLARHMPPLPRTLTVGVALWPLFAHRMLLDEVCAVEDALAVSLADGRAAVSRLVSRDVSELSEVQVRQAAIESLAENLSDSVAAPILWYALGGLPAAALYRFANTADAVWGYRTPRWRHAGTAAARADDALNLVPARITALALRARPALILEFLRHKPGKPPVGTTRTPRSTGKVHEEARRIPSPNAGWPMAALALRLGVRLEKPGVYVLVPSGREPTTSDTRHALRLARRTGFALAVGVAALAASRATLLHGDRLRETHAIARGSRKRSPRGSGRWQR